MIVSHFGQSGSEVWVWGITERTSLSTTAQTIMAQPFQTTTASIETASVETDSIKTTDTSFTGSSISSLRDAATLDHLTEPAASFSVQSATNSTGTGQFRDITGHWAAAFIEGLAQQDLLKGTKDGKFEPDALMTRSQFAALLVKLFNLPIMPPARIFGDVPTDFWANRVIQQVYHSGLMSGFDDGTFRPNQPILRTQVLLPLVKALRLSQGELSLLQRFDDMIAIPGYAKRAIAQAVQAKLVVNYPRLKQFKPNWEATRAEVAAMVYQALTHSQRMPAVRSPYIIDPTQPNQAEPQPNAPAITVVIDPGHGGSDPGAIGIDGLQEKAVIFPIAQQVVQQLAKQGIRAVLTRTEDRDLELAPRVEFAKQQRADIFVSIHANSAGMENPQVSGVETYHHERSAESGQLAKMIHQAILQAVKGSDRGVRQANFYVLRHASMPAVLVETGFVTGREDAAKLATAAHREKVAGAIVKGVLAYVKAIASA
jgi:N-acetylmuramoyl-L-alanine amidase